MEELPPLALVKTWLDVVQQTDMPNNIREKRNKLLTYYFGSIQEAKMYVKDNDNSLIKTSK
ncbi:hypothetical protein [Colwellia sp. E2M01]|uniref:hypothetical protein n=1 Tax=Colwellia sp. E2M01 TaxID=2841561 RepID=UPI001C08D63E|nr:hypothetical protein [Colwellia sp. E2M01]MBU2870958.1 hypothetical protein [Colwellia sp. E2M01]